MGNIKNNKFLNFFILAAVLLNTLLPSFAVYGDSFHAGHEKIAICTAEGVQLVDAEGRTLQPDPHKQITCKLCYIVSGNISAVPAAKIASLSVNGVVAAQVAYNFSAINFIPEAGFSSSRPRAPPVFL